MRKREEKEGGKTKERGEKVREKAGEVKDKESRRICSIYQILDIVSNLITKLDPRVVGKSGL